MFGTRDDLLLAQTLTGEIPYAANGLTVSPNDLGVEEWIFPGPAAFTPEEGLYVVDGGTDRRTWTLNRFGRNGKRTLRVDLVERLNLKNPNQFQPVEASISAGGSLQLLAARKFNSQRDRQEEFATFLFDAEGIPEKAKNLPSLSYQGKAILEGVRVWNRQKGPEGPGWYIHEADAGSNLAGRTTFSLLPVRAAGRILEKFGGSSFRRWSASGVDTLQHRGPEGWALEARDEAGNALEQEGVEGRGEYFGIIRKWPGRPTEDGQSMERRRELEINRLIAPDRTVLKVGVVPLQPDRYPLEAGPDADFALRSALCISADGDFWEMAYTPKSMRIFQYHLSL